VLTTEICRGDTETATRIGVVIVLSIGVTIGATKMFTDQAGKIDLESEEDPGIEIW